MADWLPLLALPYSLSTMGFGRISELCVCSERAVFQFVSGFETLPRVTIVTGVTAVGKTAFALDLAKRRNAEIVSADSLLVYRGMDIGTAKPSAAEQGRVPHHLIDIAEPTEPMSIGQYVQQARHVLEMIAERKKHPLVVGGSGFYLKAFYAPVVDHIEIADSLRDFVRSAAERDPSWPLAELKRVNPAGLGELDTRNPRRVINALERCLASGQTVLELQAAFRQKTGLFPPEVCDIILLRRERNSLHELIARRALTMLEAGLVDEVKRLDAQGFRCNRSAASAIGYREILERLDKGLSVAPDHYSDIAEVIALNTRRLAARQGKWLRHQIPVSRVIDL